MHPVLKTSGIDQRCKPTANSQPEKNNHSISEKILTTHEETSIFFFLNNSIRSFVFAALVLKIIQHYHKQILLLNILPLIQIDVKSQTKMPGFRSEKYLRPQSCSDSIDKKIIRNHCKTETNTKCFPFSLLLSFLPLFWMIILCVKLLIN